MSPSARCCDEAARVDTDDSETLIFVDVDGVLNVGIADPGQRAMELNDSNIKIARDNWETRMQLSKDFRNSVERVIAVCERHPDGSADPLAAHVARDGTSLSELLVWRLAQIIRTAGSKSLVVLSSSWRSEPRRVRQLEEALGRHLEEPFSFGAHTDACEESGAPEVRLQSIALFVERHCAARGPLAGRRAGRLRVLVLDDFHIQPFGWSCEQVNIDGPQAVEEFVRSRVPAPIDARVEVVHPYDEWVTPAGTSVCVGTGLTDAHLRRALGFLGGEHPAAEPAGLRVLHDGVCAPKRTLAAAAADALGRLLWWLLVPSAEAWRASEHLLGGAAAEKPAPAAERLGEPRRPGAPAGEPSGPRLEERGLVAARSLVWPM